MNNLLAAGKGEVITNPVLDGLNRFEGQTFFSKVISGAVGLTFVVGTIVFFFMLVIGAIQWITSGGDKGALEGARSKITNAIIGIVILFASFAIIKLIEHFFGNLHILQLDIGPLVI